MQFNCSPAQPRARTWPWIIDEGLLQRRVMVFLCTCMHTQTPCLSVRVCVLRGTEGETFFFSTEINKSIKWNHSCVVRCRRAFLNQHIKINQTLMSASEKSSTRNSAAHVPCPPPTDIKNKNKHALSAAHFISSVTTPLLFTFVSKEHWQK